MRIPQNLIVDLASSAAGDAARVGPKAANLAALARAGLPTPGGFCLTAAAYRLQIARLGLTAGLEEYARASERDKRRLSIDIRLKLYEGPIAAEILEPLFAAWEAQREKSGAPGVVRSSALIEDLEDASFAGQFESFLGLSSTDEMVTAVRACWAALRTTDTRRYMEAHELGPAGTAMAALIQPLVAARASGGGLSRTPDGTTLLSATWGLGSAIAQGEVVSDRIVVDRSGAVLGIEPGRKDHSDGCSHRLGAKSRPVRATLVGEPSLGTSDAEELGRMMLAAERIRGGPVEIEWALDDSGFVLLQSRPLHVQPVAVPDEIWLRHPGLKGHPAGVGWGAGRGVVVRCECELSRVGPGDILVTGVAGPALGQILPRVGGVVTELGGSTSHLAALARERGVPMVLGVPGATRTIPDGAQVAVDGVAGIVRWIR
ncbi:MAG TPA: PEP/pyruvate-binding domain-containing protein [Roseiarcus sp.]|nr:PEP/pyruvate-binding domain-containing protein [Roseiarcus sp.]